MDQCVRKLYKELHGVDAPIQMSPEGKVIEEELQTETVPCECLQRMAHYG